MTTLNKIVHRAIPTFFLAAKDIKNKTVRTSQIGTVPVTVRYRTIRYFKLDRLAFAFFKSRLCIPCTTVLLLMVWGFEKCVQNSIHNTHRVSYSTIPASVLQSTQDNYASLFQVVFVNILYCIIIYCMGFLKTCIDQYI